MKRRQIALRYFRDDACGVRLDGPARATGRCFICGKRIRVGRGQRVVIYGVRSALYVALACRAHKVKERR